MSGRLQGKVAIITGAARGQGATEAQLFAKEGAKVVATDVLEDDLTATVKAIQDEGHEALAITQDVSSEDSWQAVVDQTLAAFGKIDILINNAGITGAQLPPEELSVSEWDKVMNINALGNMLGIKHVIPAMKKQGAGSIVNISSLAGIHGIGGFSAYAASKGATRLLTMGAAKDFGPDHIRVNSIHPGFIETPMIKDFTDNPEIKKQVVDTKSGKTT
ncbi:MAG: SDR family NAD(P)-dependent oxidoreductase, partial [Levilactobacillus sp.]|nr:SDR family NAD(P)-dependent oxidoreductase [Levilactobacillus sp.]